MVSPEAKVWITTNVKQLITETVSKADALNYVSELTKECLDVCDLSVDHEQPVHDEILAQIHSHFGK